MQNLCHFMQDVCLAPLGGGTTVVFVREKYRDWPSYGCASGAGRSWVTYYGSHHSSGNWTAPPPWERWLWIPWDKIIRWQSHQTELVKFKYRTGNDHQCTINSFMTSTMVAMVINLLATMITTVIVLYQFPRDDSILVYKTKDHQLHIHF